MKNFILHNILPGSEKDFSGGAYIILFNAVTVPPHLLLSVNGAVFSITDSGRQLASPLEKLLLFIKRKNVAALFVQWKVEAENIDARKYFLNYEKVIEGKVSCLFPIRDTVAAVVGDELHNARFIFELLPLMQKANVLGDVFALNMENKITGGTFELLTYTDEHLKEALQSSMNESSN